LKDRFHFCFGVLPEQAFVVMRFGCNATMRPSIRARGTSEGTSNGVTQLFKPFIAKKIIVKSMLMVTITDGKATRPMFERGYEIAIPIVAL